MREALAVNSSITSLSVQNCRIGAPGITSIAEGLKTNTTLEKLYIQDNQVRSLTVSLSWFG